MPWSASPLLSDGRPVPGARRWLDWWPITLILACLLAAAVVTTLSTVEGGAAQAEVEPRGHVVGKEPGAAARPDGLHILPGGDDESQPGPQRVAELVQQGAYVLSKLRKAYSAKDVGASFPALWDAMVAASAMPRTYTIAEESLLELVHDSWGEAISTEGLVAATTPLLGLVMLAVACADSGTDKPGNSITVAAMQSAVVAIEAEVQTLLYNWRLTRYTDKLDPWTLVWAKYRAGPGTRAARSAQFLAESAHLSSPDEAFLDLLGWIEGTMLTNLGQVHGLCEAEIAKQAKAYNAYLLNVVWAVCLRQRLLDPTQICQFSSHVSQLPGMMKSIHHQALQNFGLSAGASGACMQKDAQGRRAIWPAVKWACIDRSEQAASDVLHRLHSEVMVGLPDVRLLVVTQGFVSSSFATDPMDDQSTCSGGLCLDTYPTRAGECQRRIIIVRQPDTYWFSYWLWRWGFVDACGGNASAPNVTHLPQMCHRGPRSSIPLAIQHVGYRDVCENKFNTGIVACLGLSHVASFGFEMQDPLFVACNGTLPGPQIRPFQDIFVSGTVCVKWGSGLPVSDTSPS